MLILTFSGEGIWHHFSVGPVAHHHASPYQENHTGWGEWPSLTCLSCYSLSPKKMTCILVFCLEPLTSICLTISPCIHRYHFFPAVFSQIQNSTPKMMVLLGMNTTLLSAGFTQYVNCILLWIRYWPRNSSAVHNRAAIPKTHTSTIV